MVSGDGPLLRLAEITAHNRAPSRRGARLKFLGARLRFVDDAVRFGNGGFSADQLHAIDVSFT
jgi:hypothetical protein